MGIMANVDDALSRPRQACPAASFYRLRREVGQVSTGARQSEPLPSSSTDDDFEDAGNDSVIEVVPTPRKIPEIDLTSSPLPNDAAPNKRVVRVDTTEVESLLGDLDAANVSGSTDADSISEESGRRSSGAVSAPPRPRLPTIVIDDDDDEEEDSDLIEILDDDNVDDRGHHDSRGIGEVDLEELERSLAAAAVATHNNSDSDAGFGRKQ